MIPRGSLTNSIILVNISGWLAVRSIQLVHQYQVDYLDMMSGSHSISNKSQPCV